MEKRVVFEYAPDDDCLVDDNTTVFVRQMNHIVEVVAVKTKINGLKDIKKLSKSEYIRLSTGELFEYKLSTDRSQNIESLKETFKRVRWIINNNFTGGSSEMFLTLTYAENMLDLKKLYKDFKIFWKRWLRKYGNNFEYVTIVEPQGRGAWHCHCLIKTRDGTDLFIPWEQILKFWQHGSIEPKRLKDVDNIGAYLTSYLTNMEADDLDRERIREKHEIDNLKLVEVSGETKAIIKGKRLIMYPPGMNILRHSKGITYPDKQEMKMEEIKKIVGACTPNYKRKLFIKNDEKLVNEIVYLNYNIRRQEHEEYSDL